MILPLAEINGLLFFNFYLFAIALLFFLFVLFVPGLMFHLTNGEENHFLHGILIWQFLSFFFIQLDKVQLGEQFKLDVYVAYAINTKETDARVFKQMCKSFDYMDEGKIIENKAFRAG